MKSQYSALVTELYLDLMVILMLNTQTKSMLSILQTKCALCSSCFLKRALATDKEALYLDEA